MTEDNDWSKACGRGYSNQRRAVKTKIHPEAYKFFHRPAARYSHPFWRAMRAASTRFSAPSLLMASER